MNKTHVLDFPITGCQYHNRQVTLRFCARRGARRSAGSGIGLSAGRSVGSGTRPSAGMSARLSAESRNIVHFLPVTSKNVNQILGSIKT